MHSRSHFAGSNAAWLGVKVLVHDHFGAHPELIPLLSGENLLRARYWQYSGDSHTVMSLSARATQQPLAQSAATLHFCMQVSVSAVKPAHSPSSQHLGLPGLHDPPTAEHMQ
jgi:hypothetical protein